MPYGQRLELSVSNPMKMNSLKMEVFANFAQEQFVFIKWLLVKLELRVANMTAYLLIEQPKVNIAFLSQVQTSIPSAQDIQTQSWLPYFAFFKSSQHKLCNLVSNTISS
ncbi:unnamed protein product (macronuclear) [Paramecium tetraurelia]|uniref:Uncharacterized protein n=1 Tax=Paramecium tetraurelia TaxID=5888 RepID=A0DB05_PARTE|nr:uncharacterized protein GSPATT00039379001 [Paramecium tetraurelia]CAK80222.1 unnamed protein product [Paramecium tetraurelia]|eukprot:XP_001447619.1 hypothetical protein (macronuclear) [Paramecium tetraurelia strain d4-2]